jgi:hypothetical protein
VIIPPPRGRTSSIDKPPWNTVEAPRGAVETDFLRPVLLGESIAPFRLLRPALAVVPATAVTLLDAATAADFGYRHLATWMRDIEGKWTAHSRRGAEGLPRMTLKERLDFGKGLSRQLPVEGLKVVYVASGTALSSAITDEGGIIVEHGAYWSAVRSLDEARYLTALLNSGIVVPLIASMQPRGAGGPRHFDKLVWELPFPEFDSRQALHRQLSDAGVEAERIAGLVELQEGAYFTTHRRVIRDALAADGIAAQIDTLVARLLDG